MDCVRVLNEFILGLLPHVALNLKLDNQILPKKMLHQIRHNIYSISMIQSKLIILGQPREKLVIYSRIQDSMTKE